MKVCMMISSLTFHDVCVCVFGTMSDVLCIHSPRCFSVKKDNFACLSRSAEHGRN